MARCGCIIRSYYLTEYLARVISNYAWVDKVIVANYRFPNVELVKDDTAEIVALLNQGNVKLIGTPQEVLEQRVVFDKARQELLDCELIFISDADEFLLPSDQKKIAENIRPTAVQVFTNVIDYSNVPGYSYVIRTHRPMVAVRPFIEFTGTRAGLGDGHYFKDIYMHHFGYAKDNPWKEKNIWYPKTSFDYVVCQKMIKQPFPDELKEILK